jgi:hypothetical protein
MYRMEPDAQRTAQSGKASPCGGKAAPHCAALHAGYGERKTAAFAALADVWSRSGTRKTESRHEQREAHRAAAASGHGIADADLVAHMDLP